MREVVLTILSLSLSGSLVALVLFALKPLFSAVYEQILAVLHLDTGSV